MPSALDCYFFLGDAPEILGRMLNQSETEYRRFSQADSERKMTYLLYRELVKGSNKYLADNTRFWTLLDSDCLQYRRLIKDAENPEDKVYRFVQICLADFKKPVYWVVADDIAFSDYEAAEVYNVIHTYYGDPTDSKEDEEEPHLRLMDRLVRIYGNIDKAIKIADECFFEDEALFSSNRIFEGTKGACTKFLMKYLKEN